MCAKVARFYGWSWREIQTMPYRELHTFWLAISPIQAEECRLAIRTNNFYNLKESARKDFERSLDRAGLLIDNGERDKDAQNYDGLKTALLRMINGR